jgi:succinate dehydrogenase (ubiquinone) membrane anchor subunit
LFSTTNPPANSLLSSPLARQVNQHLSRSTASVASAKHWNAERYLSVALLAVIPAGLLLENNLFDHLMAVSLVLHSHWGLQQIMTDYLHGPSLPKIGSVLLYVVSALTLVGLLYFNYSDIGISKAVKKIWSL